MVRRAKRLADQLHAPWTAISIETSETSRASVAEKDSTAEALRLAQQLGAEPVLIPGQDAADSIIDMLLAKGRASDRKEWLMEEGNKAEILE